MAEMQSMTAGGWIFMVLAWTSIVILNAFCFWKVLSRHSD